MGKNAVLPVSGIIPFPIFLVPSIKAGINLVN